MIGTNTIIDTSHWSGNVNLAKAQAAGITAVIQKATTGLTSVDPTLAKNRQKAQDSGLQFGAYHFGTGSDGVQQADHFLKTISPQPGDLLVLDFEANPTGPSMTLNEAQAFVTHVQSVTGVWPGLYSGHYLKELLGTRSDPVLSNCWLWLAQYGPTPVIPHAWSKWAIWQYTDGAAGPVHVPVPGVSVCDRDTFNGTADDLATFWKANGCK